MLKVYLENTVFCYLEEDTMEHDAKHYTTKRNPELELWRFLAAVIIMIYHSYILGWEGYPFSESGWFYVEFFFILSGYFITAHVRSRKNAESLWGGVFRRIKKIYPYLLLSAIWGCIVFWFRMTPTRKMEVVDIIERFTASILFLSGNIIGFPEYVGGMWYVSVLFLVMPLFMFVVSKKEFSAAVCLLVPVLVYTNMGAINGLRSPFHDVLRGFSAMLLGTFVYEMIPYIKSLSERIGAVAAAALRWGCFIFVMILMFYNSSNRWLMLICFILSIGFSIQNNPQYPVTIAKVFCFCGEESVVIYLMQYASQCTVQLLFSEKTLKEQLILYYAITVIVSTGILLLKKQWDQYRRRVGQTKT